MEDYYQTLGVARTATAAEIKKAYRRLAHKYHPDKNGGDEDQFKKVNAAYQVLGNQQKRSQFDRYGHAFDGSASAGHNPSGQGVHVDFGDFEGMGDIFEQFFGGRGRQPRRSVRRGNDVGIDISISFEESASGTNQEVTHRIYQTCSRCRGNGAEPNTAIKECSRCRGSGQISTTRNTVFGAFVQRSICPDCGGEGKKAEVPCSQCRGDGREISPRTLEIKIPAGIADGQAVKLTGKGEAPAGGGVNGDLFATIHVRPHKQLRRDGQNIRSRVNVNMADAALGASVPVATLEGQTELKIPAGTQPATEIRLSGLGFPSLTGSNRGDQLVTVEVKIPDRLSRKQKKLLEEFRTAKSGLFK